MISVSVATNSVFADGVAVKAYLKNQVADTRRAPIGASVAEGTTATGAVTLSLEPGVDYYIGAEVSSKWVYVHTTAPAANTDGYATVASAAGTITLPAGAVIKVTGTATITKITPQLGAKGVPKKVTLIFESTATLTDGENLKLASTLVATADDTISLVCPDNVNWYETARSVN